MFAVELLGSGEVVGAVGLSVADAPTEVAGQVMISWRLGRVFWGQGYASKQRRQHWNSPCRIVTSTVWSPSAGRATGLP